MNRILKDDFYIICIFYLINFIYLQINSQIYSQSLLLKSSNLKFYRVTDLQDVLTLKTSHPEAKIVVGNTEVGMIKKIRILFRLHLECKYYILYNRMIL